MMCIFTKRSNEWMCVCFFGGSFGENGKYFFLKWDYACGMCGKLKFENVGPQGCCGVWGSVRVKKFGFIQKVLLGKTNACLHTVRIPKLFGWIFLHVFKCVESWMGRGMSKFFSFFWRKRHVCLYKPKIIVVKLKFCCFLEGECVEEWVFFLK